MNLHTVKSNLSDFAASTLDHVTDTLHHGQDAVNDTTRMVGKDVARTASRIRHSDSVDTVADKIVTLTKVVAAATSAKALATALNPDVPMRWMLGALNLQRRPSLLFRVATGVGLVTLGAAVGAGVAMLLSPQNGAQNRARLRRSLGLLRQDAKEVVAQVETKAQAVVEKVEAQVHDAVHHADGTARVLHPDAHEAAPNDAAKGTGGAGTTSTKSRTPGLSHRSPRG